MQIPTGYMDYAMKRESGGNANARNPRSSATGLYQFITPTWNELMVQHPELGLTPDGRTDPEQQKRAMEVFTKKNAEYLTKNGHPINNDTLYAAHRFGPAGANKMLSGDPSMPMNQAFGQNVMQANPDLRGKTIQDILGGYQNMAPQNPMDQAMLPQGAQPAQGQMQQPQHQAQPQQQGYDWGGALQGAGAALASIGSPSQGAALASLIQRSQKKDGTADWEVKGDAATGYVRYNKRTGEMEQIKGSGTPGLTKAQEAVDKKWGETYEEYIVQGKSNDTLKSLSQLKEAATALETEKDLSGPYLGSLDPTYRRMMGYNRSAEIQQTVEEIVQRSLRETLGAQFTEREGERLIARAYDPRASEPENFKRVSRLVKSLEGAHAAKMAAAEHYGQYGTLSNYKGLSTADIEKNFLASVDYEDKQDATSAAPANTGFKVLKVH